MAELHQTFAKCFLMMVAGSCGVLRLSGGPQQVCYTAILLVRRRQTYSSPQNSKKIQQIFTKYINTDIPKYVSDLDNY